MQAANSALKSHMSKKSKPPAEENIEQTDENPPVKHQAAALKKLIAKGKARGFITYDELNKTLPAGRSAVVSVTGTTRRSFWPRSLSLLDRHHL